PVRQLPGHRFVQVPAGAPFVGGTAAAGQGQPAVHRAGDRVHAAHHQGPDRAVGEPARVGVSSLRSDQDRPATPITTSGASGSAPTAGAVGACPATAAGGAAGWLSAAGGLWVAGGLLVACALVPARASSSVSAATTAAGRADRRRRREVVGA